MRLQPHTMLSCGFPRVLCVPVLLPWDTEHPTWLPLLGVGKPLTGYDRPLSPFLVRVTTGPQLRETKGRMISGRMITLPPPLCCYEDGRRMPLAVSVENFGGLQAELGVVP